MEKHGQKLTKKERDAVRRLERRDALVASRGNKCEVCRVSYPNWMYDFHHVNPEEKNMELGKAAMNRKWESILLEFEKCIIVCPNCHRTLHIKMEKNNG